MARSGWTPTDDFYDARLIENSGHNGGARLSDIESIRPVFYLSSDIIIQKETTGEIDNPYIILI